MSTYTEEHTPDAMAPGVDELLDVDREFRESQRQTLHVVRGDRRYSVLYSPSALAWRMGKGRDWVIIDLESPGPNPHWTVVTEWRGVLRGKRVVRGREVESYAFHHSPGGRRHRRSALKAAG